MLGLVQEPPVQPPCFHPAFLRSVLPTATRGILVNLMSQIASLLCSKPSVALISLRETAKVLPMAHKGMCDLPLAPLATLTPYYLLLLPSLTPLQPLAASAPGPHLRAFALSVSLCPEHSLPGEPHSKLSPFPSLC